MLKFLKLFLVSVAVILLTACGGSSSGDSSIDSSGGSVVEKLSDSTIVYNASPVLNRELNITIEINDDTAKSGSYTWSVVSQPDGANLKLTSLDNGHTVILKPAVVGEYVLKITDSSGNEKVDRFTVSEIFPFDENQIEGNDGNKSIDEISGIVKNQYWVTSMILSEDELNTIISKYSVLTSVGYDEVNGVLIESNGLEQDINEAIKSLELEQGILSVNHRVYTGEKVDTDFKLPDDGSKFDDGGDNWHLEFLNMDKVWDVITGNKDLFVGIADGGFYSKHDDLKGKFEKKYTSNEDEHGTGVSGTIGANTDNKEGMSGINWISKLVVNSYEPDCENDVPLNYVNILKYSDKVKLINSSWGCMEKNSGTQQNGIKKTRTFRNVAIAYPNKLHIWAAGNDGANADTQNGALHLKQDGNYNELKNVIVVTALLKDKKLAVYSDYGRTVDIAAPTEFKSTKSSDIYYEADKPNDYGTNYSGGFNGTSAAAPVVTGVASLVYSLIPELKASDVKSILIKSSTSTVSERYIDNDKTTIDFTTKENGSHPAIPILNAEAALKMAKDIKDGKISKVEHTFPKPFKPEALVRVGSANAKLETKKVSFDLAGSTDGTNWTFLDSKSSTSSDISVPLNNDYFYYRLTGSVDLEHSSTGIVSKSIFDEQFSVGNIIAVAKDTTTLEAITGVSIEVQPMFSSVSGLPVPKGSGSVAEDGKVRLYLNKGSYKIIAKKEGYKDFHKIINVSDFPTSTAVDILMTSDSVDFVGTIGGIVFGDNGEPIKNALIRLTGGEQTNGFFKSAVTDDLGMYNLSNINKKDSNGNLITSFTLSASAKGYSEVIKENIVVLSASSVNYNFTLLIKDTSETVIYSTSFEESTSNWISTGLWHIQDLKTTSIVNNLVDNGFVSLSPDEETNYAYLPSADDGNNALWYGSADTGSFIGTQQDGDNLKSGGTSVASHKGTVTSPLIDLAGTTQPILSFRTWWEIEAVNPNENGYDIMEIKIAVDGGEFTTIKRLNPYVDPSIENREDKAFSSAGVIRKPIWVLEELDLSEYAGKNIYIQFSFDTKDGRFNGFRGWFIDTLSIIEGTDNNNQSSKISKIINIDTQKRNIFDGLSEKYIKVHKKPLKYINREKTAR